jgi:uncharacterized surface protein with fasciclin (FAS1) repeats
MKINFLNGMLMACLFFQSCEKVITVILPDTPKVYSLDTTLANSPNLQTFTAALKYTGLLDSMLNRGSYTIFAPDDNAFDSLGIKSVSDLEKMDKGTLTTLLKYHIISNNSFSLKDIAQITNNEIMNWANLPLYISIPYSIGKAKPYGDFLAVNGVTSKAVDLKASNAVIHTLFRILNYPKFTNKEYLMSDTSFSLFVTLLNNFDLWKEIDSVNPTTILAPKNSVFRKEGIKEINISKLDSFTYPKTLVLPYLLPNKRVFTSDFFIFNSSFTYISKDQSCIQLWRVFPSGGNSPEDIFYAPIYIFVAGKYIGSSIFYDLREQNFDISFLSLTDRFSQGVVTNPVKIIERNNMTLNGVIHVIDNLLAYPKFIKKYK